MPLKKKRKWVYIAIAAAVVVIGGFYGQARIQTYTANAQQYEMNWKPVELAMGTSGKLTADGVYKFSLPRRDLQVTVEGVQINPTFALGTWLGFKSHNDKAMVMGDLVLTVDEINVVMDKLFNGNIKVTALHNHLLDESPRIMYMHFEGLGDPVQMAKTLHGALELTKTPLNGNRPTLASDLPLDTKRIDQVLGYKGQISQGVYQFNVPRAEKITEDDMEIPPSMGTASPLNFQPTGDGKAAITGDFVLTAEEVYPVAHALRDNGIKVTAVHNHMLNEKPRLFFMHFWANDDAIKLAKGLRQALVKMNVSK